MYKLGTYVSYRSEGVCVITEIRHQKFGTLNELKDFYILSPINDLNSTLFVPTDNEMLVGKMRLLCSASDVNLLAKDLFDKRLDWIELPRPRNNYFKELLSDGKRDNLILLIHTVCDMEIKLAQNGKHVTQSDLTAVARAKKMLVDEFSVTTDITTEQKLMDVLTCKEKCRDKETYMTK